MIQRLIPDSDIVLILSLSLFCFFVTLLICPPFIKLLRKWKIGKNIREEASGGGKAKLFSQLHAKKSGTPTMGGAVIVLVLTMTILITVFLEHLGVLKVSLVNRAETYIPLFTFYSCALLGAVDDWLNIKNLWKKGIPVTPKFIFLLILSLVGAWWFTTKLDRASLFLPFIGEVFVNHIYYALVFVFVFVASGNAVNFTDGLDGLAAGLLIMSYTVFASIAFAQSLFILSAFCACIAGSLLGFLLYNANPARFFMGDLGSLSLGATLGVISLLTNSIVPLMFCGIVYIFETLSVIIQLSSKKLFKRKVFLIAPIHHHFEKIGWPESLVVVRFWIIGGVGSLLGLIFGLLQ